MDSDAYGILIFQNTTIDFDFKAVYWKYNINWIHIYYTRTLNHYHFLKKVFETFEKYKMWDSVYKLYGKNIDGAEIIFPSKW